MSEPYIPPETPAPTGPEPSRARAVFSTEDFKLLREAVLSHLQRPEVQDSKDSIKFGNLYHRLGRLA